MKSPHILKISIASNLLWLLILNAFLVNGVMVIFWFHSNINTQVNSIRQALLSWSTKINHCAQLRSEKTDETFNDILVGYEIGSIGVVTSCEGEFYYNDNSTIENTTALTEIKLALQSEKKIAQFLYKGFFIPSVKLVTIDLGNTDVPFNQIGIWLKVEGSLTEIMKKQKIIVVYVIFNVFVVVIIGFFRLRTLLLRPIEKLASVAEKHDFSKHSTLLMEGSTNEFSVLENALNGMLKRIELDQRKLKEYVTSLEESNQQLIHSQQNMVRAEKMAAVGRLAAGLAHEIGNPLGISLGYIELLQDESLTTEDRKEYSKRTVKELERINRMVRDLLDFSRKKSPIKNETSDVQKVCKDAVSIILTQGKELEIQVNTYHGEGVDGVKICRDNLYQVLVNCIINSLDGIRERGIGFLGHISLSTELVKIEKDCDYVDIKIVDNGLGIPEEELNSVFDPFFTTKDIGKGTGLGLSVSCAIIETAQGHMEIDSKYGEGTTVIIRVPKAKSKFNV